MSNKKSKTIMLNTLLLIFCCVIIALFSLTPKGEEQTRNVTLSFDAAGGSKVAAIEVEECGIVKQPEDPTREGYVFVGWLYEGKLFDFSKEVCGDIQLKASWKEIEPDKTYFTITFDTGEGGTTIPNLVVEEGEIPEAPEAPVREGYNFMGWTFNGEPYDFTTPISGSGVVTAVWEEIPAEDNSEYTVKFDLAGGTGEAPDQIVKSGERATRPADPTREGYTFNGWSPNINNPITKDTTFRALWKSNNTNPPSGGGGGGGDTPTEPEKYEVWYYLDGERICRTPVQTVAVGSAISPNCNPTIKEHYHANGGWSCPGTMSSGGARCDMSSSKNTFTSVCSKSGNTGSPTCKLSFYENGNEIQLSNVSVSSGNFNGTFDSGANAPLGKVGSYTFTVTLNGEQFSGTGEVR